MSAISQGRERNKSAWQAENGAAGCAAMKSRRTVAVGKTLAWRVEASLAGCGRRWRKKAEVRGGSGRLQHGVARGFKDEAGEVEGQGEGVGEEHGFGSVGEAEGAGAFELAASLGGIATFGIGLSADAQLPGVGVHGDVTRQAEGTIRQGEASGQGEAEGMVGMGEGTGGTRLPGGSAGNIRIRLVDAFETTDPFGGLALVVVAIGGQAVAMRTERDAVGIVAARQTGERVFISIGMAQTDGA